MGLDRVDGCWERGLAHRRFVQLSVAGYRVTEMQLHLGLPGGERGAKQPTISGWTRGDSVYIGAMACEQLRD